MAVTWLARDRDACGSVCLGELRERGAPIRELWALLVHPSPLPPSGTAVT